MRAWQMSLWHLVNDVGRGHDSAQNDDNIVISVLKHDDSVI